MANGVIAALSMSPIGQSFGGDYRLRFDMWINANGEFPVGGTGSSQYITAGVGTTGGHVQWTGSGAVDGYWFAVNGEGQAGDTSGTSDYGAYSNKTVQAAGSGVYYAGTDSNARGNLNAYYTTAFPAGQTPPPLQQTNYPNKPARWKAGRLASRGARSSSPSAATSSSGPLTA